MTIFRNKKKCHKIQRLLRQENEKAIIAGDFNDNSTQLGINFMDIRNYIMCWFAQNNLKTEIGGKKANLSKSKL